MKNIVNKTNLINIFFYVSGMVITALGVVLLLRSNLGISPWDTLNYSFSQILDISYGNGNFIISSSLVVFVTIKEKRIKYLLIVIPIFVVTRFIDLFNNTMFLSDSYQILPYQLSFFVFGILILALGAAFMIFSRYPAGIYEEFMLTIMRIFKTEKLALTRVSMEVIVVVIAFIIGAFGGFWLGKINLGTIFISLTFGYILNFFLVRLQHIRKKNQLKI